MTDAIDIVTFYDEHPINLAEILSRAQADGLDLAQLTARDLWQWDQDHYGGLQAVDTLADALAIDAASHVIDLCSGMGGPARYLATTRGCRVHGVDLNQSRVDGANELTRRVNLDERVSFSQADICALPMQDAHFDRAISQEAFLHIENREALLQQVRRVLQTGGKLGFTDWIAGAGLSNAHQQRFADTFAASRIVSIEEYRELLPQANLQIDSVTDLSDEWREILRERLEMFRSLESDTVARFGQQRHDSYIANYEFFVERISAGHLGGARFIATAV